MSPEVSDSGRLAAEPLVTTHRLLAAFDRDAKGLEWLHGDLFDSRPEVALSAMDALGSLANPASFTFVTRVLATASGELAIAALRALGKIRHPGTARALVNLLKTTREEALRREILDALANAVPKDHELAGFVRQIAHSPLASAGARAHAVGLLLRLRGEAALDELLADSREEILDQVLRSSAETPALVAKVVERCSSQYRHLPARTRVSLVSVALTQDLEATAGLLRDALSDPVADVRRAAYVGTAVFPHHSRLFQTVIEGLLGRAETNAAIEDEVHELIRRMARTEGASRAVPVTVRARVISSITEHFNKLREEGRHISSDSHELGWLIMRSKEYLEYYCDEEFKAALLRYLKGASTDSEDDLLKKLKATAVRVEVRHFDGYTALAEVIKNPQRTGMGLVARELALAKPGKGLVFWQLIRALRLASVILTPEAGSSTETSLKAIYAWARGEKLFRLAEAALWAFARVNPASAVEACNECLTPPIASKVLAITSLHLLRELSPSELEPASARLLSAQDDAYITLNAAEALTAFAASSNGDLAKALLTRLSLSSSREVVESLAAYLGDKVSLDITESLRDMYAGGDATRKSAVLTIMGRRVASGFIGNREGTVEFLYKILRGSDTPRRRAAGVILWRLGDDYASEVMRDFLSTGTVEERAETLRSLKGQLRAQLLPFLAPLLAAESPVIHEPLRELLLGATEDVRAGVLELALHLRGTPAGEDSDLRVAEEPGAAVDFRTERTAFQFERENVQDLVILFTDIQGYSKKAQFLTPQQVSSLIQDYEKILLAHTEAHRGELIKRMGDGHMFVFHDPLAAVLAAIRLQKSLKRFNRYREEISRVVIRIGIHCGKVVRKEHGDVLGNTVNIASRLESSAQPGSVLVSELVHEKVKDHIHAREIGRITVKNITEPIRVYEPYEVVLDLPAALDPLKSAKAEAPAAQAAAPNAADRTARAGKAERAAASRGSAASAATAGGASDVVNLDPEVLRQIQSCFESLESLCRDAQGGNVPLVPINEKVLAPWDRIRSRLPSPGRTGAPEVDRMDNRAQTKDFPLRSIVDALPLSIFWKDKDSRYLGCNEFLRAPPDFPVRMPLPGLSDIDMPWADNAERHRQEDQRILQTGEPWRAYDEVTATRDGTRVFMRTAKVPLRDSAGQVVGIVGAYEWINHTELAPMDIPDSEERLRALTENAAEAVVVIQDGRIVYVNARGREIFGATQEDLAGVPVESVVHPRDRRRVRNDFARVLGGEEPAFASLYELRIVNRQRRVRWLQASTVLIPWAGKAATLHFIIDVTPLRRQKEVQEASNRASISMAGASTLDEIFPLVARELASIDFLMHVFLLNADGTLSLSFLGKESGAAAKLSKIVGTPIEAPFVFRDQAEFAQVIHGRRTLLITDMGKLLSSVFPQDLREAIPPVMKALAALRMILAPLADDSSVIGMIALENADMVEEDLPAIMAFALQMGYALHRARLAQAMAAENAERRRAQEESARLFAAIEQAAEYVLITDADGTITYTNPAFERVTGYSRDEAIGKSPRILKSGRQDRAFYDKMWKVLMAGNVWRGQLINRRKDGSTYLEEASISPVKAEDGRIVSYVAVKRDVTEAAELEERLRHAQKMEAVGRLAGGVAHDFNNILTTITGYADLLLTGLGEEDPRAAEVREILAASRRATGLTRQLLTFSRKQVISPRLVSLNAVIENLHAMLRPLIGEDIQLDYELSPELWPVLADTGQIEQLILNLSVNARDAMRGGGTLTFRTYNLRREAGPPATPREQVGLSVRDTGVGMSEEVRSHLFEPFFTTKKAGAGTGLGLATVYGIVNQNQGHIEVSSESGKGTEFRIYFPRVAGTISREEGERDVPEIPRGRETILLVEDEKAVRSLTCILLRGWGYSVLEAALPSEAITIAEREGDSIRLLLTDVVIPGMRGSELANHVLPKCRSAAVLFMSGYPDDEGLGLGGQGPSVHFLPKPFAPESLARKVRETIDGA